MLPNAGTRRVKISGNMLMKRIASVNVFIAIAMVLLVLSVAISVVSLFPGVTGGNETRVVIDDSFRLTPLETWRQGLGSFRGGENISVLVHGAANCPVNFSMTSYNGTAYSQVSTGDIKYSFTAEPDYYEAVFVGSKVANDIHFTVSVQEPKVLFPFSWLSTPAKILFFLSFGSVMLLLLKTVYNDSSTFTANQHDAPLLSRKNRQILLILLLVSLALWLILLAVNTNPMATFENWYTDNARNPYSATLFTKVGFSIFKTPLGNLASTDSSAYKFVTWPEMPHLYPVGSVLLFLPFGLLLQNGVNQVFVFKMEIALFLLFSHVGVYFFLKRFWKQTMNLPLKLLGVYIIYVALIVYSADGMFDAVAFLFAIIGLGLFLSGRYDYFIGFVAVAATLKYQAGIFLFPLVILSLMKLFRQHGSSALKNKALIAAAFLAVIDVFTAYLSAPFVLSVRPELVMNGVNAFSPHSQTPWALQSFAVLLTLSATLIFAVYMLRKNNLLSFSAIFLLLPIFMLPYFQPWYLPFLFMYVVIPRQKKEAEATMLWLVFMVAVLSFGGVAFNPLQILSNLQKLLNP
jgi:hypothetical protein